MNLPVPGKHLSVDFYELCRLSGSGTLERCYARISVLPFPPGWDVAREHRNETGSRIWSSTGGTAGKLGFALEGAGGRPSGFLRNWLQQGASLLWPVWMSPALLEWRKQILELPSF